MALSPVERLAELEVRLSQVEMALQQRFPDLLPKPPTPAPEPEPEPEPEVLPFEAPPPAAA